MLIANIAGYKFLPLSELPATQALFAEKCQTLDLKGTILLSPEGINISLAGSPSNIDLFKTFLQADSRFADITFHETESTSLPFNHLKIKIKNEIITMRTPDIKPEIKQAPNITPQELKQWLDEGRDITLLDTRNDYEVRFGTFKNAINPNINSFSNFSQAAEIIDPNKPVVMFCTGGIRCEKAALLLLQKGFQHVFQLQKGILNYFKEVGSTHYEGECFVFDERISVDARLAVTGTKQCKICQGPIKADSTHVCP